MGQIGHRISKLQIMAGNPFTSGTQFLLADVAEVEAFEMTEQTGGNVSRRAKRTAWRDSFLSMCCSDLDGCEGRLEFLQRHQKCDKQLFSYQAGDVPQGVHVTKSAKTVSLVVIVAGVVIAFVFIARDLLLRRHGVFDCGDGPRRTIDMREFATEYSAYSLDLEANVADKVKVSTKLKPLQQQQLSEALQSANEFRKYVVAGYNACAITKVQYTHDGERFHAMDGVARQINGLLAKPSLSQQESSSLVGLVDEYGRLAAQASTR